MQTPHSRQVLAFPMAGPTISRARSGVMRLKALLAHKTELMAIPWGQG
jgi:hypothetical protein